MAAIDPVLRSRLCFSPIRVVWPPWADLPPGQPADASCAVAQASGLTRFLRDEAIMRLVHVSLADCMLRDLTCLAALRLATRLRTLDLARNGLPPVALARLADFLRASSLTALDLSGNRLGDGGLELHDYLSRQDKSAAKVTPFWTFAEAVRDAHLERLELRDNMLRNADLAAFLAPLKSAKPSLSALGLAGNSLSSEVAALVDCPRLTTLDLSHCPIRSEVSFLSEELAKRGTLTALSLAGTDLTTGSVSSVARIISQVKVLSLARCGLTPGVSFSLIMRAALHEASPLEVFDISGNDFTCKGTSEIGRELAGNSSLRVLRLAYCKLLWSSAKDARIMADKSTLSSEEFAAVDELRLGLVRSVVRELDVEGNELAPYAVAALTRGLPLEVLSLKQNPIGDAYCAELSRKGLLALSLSEAEISSVGAAAIGPSP